MGLLNSDAAVRTVTTRLSTVKPRMNGSYAINGHLDSGKRSWRINTSEPIDMGLAECCHLFLVCRRWKYSVAKIAREHGEEVATATTVKSAFRLKTTPE